jgi:hypothetical protein
MKINNRKLWFNGAKGQFYILTAAILCIATYAALHTSERKLDWNDDRFQAVVENIMIESPKVINYAVANQHNVIEDFEMFEEDLQDYLKSINAKIEIIYLIRNGNFIYIKNLFNESISVQQHLQITNVNPNIRLTLQKTPNLVIIADGVRYNYNFSNTENLELKMLFIKSKD